MKGLTCSLWVFIFMLISVSTFSQGKDMSIIKLRAGDEIKAKISSITVDKVEYKYYYFLEGQSFILDKEKIAYIINPDGTKEIFGVVNTPVESITATDTVTFTLQKTQEARKLGYTITTSVEGHTNYITTLLILDKKGLPVRVLTLSNISQSKRVTIEIKNIQTGEDEENYMFTYSDLSGCLFTDNGDSVTALGKQYTNLYIASFIDNTKTYLALHFIQKIGEYSMLFDHVSDELLARNKDFKYQAMLYEKFEKDNEQRINDSIKKQAEIAAEVQRKLDEARRVNDSIVAERKKAAERYLLYQKTYFPKTYEMGNKAAADEMISRAVQSYVAENKVADCYIKTTIALTIDTNGSVISAIIPKDDVDRIKGDDNENNIIILRSVNDLCKRTLFPVTKVNVDGESFPVKAQYSYPLQVSVVNSTEKYHFNSENELVAKGGDEINGDIKSKIMRAYGSEHPSGAIKVELYKLHIGPTDITNIREVTNKDGSHPEIDNKAQVSHPTEVQKPPATLVPAPPVVTQAPKPAQPVAVEIVNVKPTQPAQPVAPIQPSHTVTVYKLGSPEELTKYKNLLDAGVISQQEYDAAKKKILDN